MNLTNHSSPEGPATTTPRNDSGLGGSRSTSGELGDPQRSLSHNSGNDRAGRRGQAERKQKAGASRNWLSGEPNEWVGKRIRNKKSGATYVIRNVYKNGRVELEKSWMTYASDVKALQTDYES